MTATPTFGASLKTARQLCNLSLREVEEATGISNAYVCHLEGDKIRRPSLFMVGKLCALYGLDVQTVMARTLEMRPLKGEIFPKGYLSKSDVKPTPAEEQELALYLLFMRVRDRKKGVLETGSPMGPEFYKHIEEMEAQAEEEMGKWRGGLKP